MKLRYIFSAFVVGFTAANLIVKYFGAPGLWVSSFVLIPFDFVVRCIIHERLKGARLVLTLFLLTVIAAGVTMLLNWDAKNIALASVFGFCAAQLGAGIFYQANKRSTNWFYKVNISDLIAIVFDSFVFQYVAFGLLDWKITLGQIVVKFAGGLLWYYIIFKKLKLHETFNRR